MNPTIWNFSVCRLYKATCWNCGFFTLYSSLLCIKMCSKKGHYYNKRSNECCNMNLQILKLHHEFEKICKYLYSAVNNSVISGKSNHGAYDVTVPVLVIICAVIAWYYTLKKVSISKSNVLFHCELVVIYLH